MAEIAPNRIRTDLPATEQTRSQREQLARRLHADNLRPKGRQGSGSQHHRSYHYRHRAKDTVQSAVDLKPPTNFEHILRGDKKSPDSSRRGSGNPHPADGNTGGVRQFDLVEKKVRPEDVAKAKRDNVQREEDLRASLRDIEEVGMSSTKQLDNTYYSILDKASILRSTVASIQQLVEETKTMRTSFQEDTGKLERDTKHNVESFRNFDQQEQTINKLVSKLHGSRERTEELNNRLEAARLRVAAFEKRDNERQARRRTTWRISWATMLGVALLLGAILLAKNRRQVGLDLDTVGQHLANIGDVLEDVTTPLYARLKTSPSEDPYLNKLFDEL